MISFRPKGFGTWGRFFNPAGSVWFRILELRRRFKKQHR
jgi:hypothetical protein